MKTKWYFPISPGGQHDGFNDPGIETYTGKRFPSLAREVLQNSLDAVALDTEKITVEFEVVDIHIDEFPGHISLKDNLEKCVAGLSGDDDEKARKFFNNALDVIKQDTVRCLCIRDYGTTGLRGNPDDSKSQWSALIKGRGGSVKSNTNAGGSYGIGKFAPFVVSDLRTVFYTTRYKDENEQTVERALGKSVLMSRNEGGGNYTSGTGFFSVNKKCQPLEGNDIPKCLRYPERNEGTQLFIAGFPREKDWEKKIVTTIISNFFYAISEGKLEVIVTDNETNDNAEVIEKKTLPELFEKFSNYEDVKYASYYYQAFQNGDNERDMELSHLGHCRLWITIGEDLPQRVALLRNAGMLITDEPKIQGLQRWPNFENFAAMFICDSKEGNALLRQMENPQHDNFEPERMGDEAEKGKKALKELSKVIRDRIKGLAKPESYKQADLDELAEFFPDVEPEERLSGEGEERNLEGSPIYEMKPIKTPREDYVPNPDEEGPSGDREYYDNDNGGGGGNNNRVKEGDDEENQRPKNKLKAMAVEKIRVLQDGEEEKNKRIIFTPLESGMAQISLQIAGDSDYETLNIESSRKGSIKKLSGKNMVEIEVEKDKRLSIPVTLQESFSGAVLVSVSKEVEET